ncbi:hypothetical protein P171DRAFT_522791 [Karstenula rhodostoma CBS 690.94]|uniref:AB hydrolase-1 domain-containing protein n=1 Tax=Karstenula rhodostoma CBS 690.94 TaxID=1392251 RepID=A0A9P4PDR6_9PLEO|nr:hypothetical protein P171DRAFT_522791 [Karstenula rhodostoma CBS 690.94]
MLLGNSTFEYALIKAFICFSSYLGLLCLVYFYLALSIGGVSVVAHPVSIAIEVVGAIEILFYLCWFLPYRSYLWKQKALFPPPLNRKQRQDLWVRSLAVTPDIELYVKKWMCGASLEDLRRENLKEWLLWALFDRQGPPGDDDDELEEYVEAVEEMLGKNIRPGWGPGTCLRPNFRKFSVSHRSLTYYMLVGTIDFWTSMILLISGFTFYRQPRGKFLKTFPLRPLTLLAPNQSAAPNFSYFYRPHLSTTHRPIVLIHGLGIGLAAYLPLLLMMPKDIGILAIEVLPTSSRITEALPLPADQAREIGDIIAQQNLSAFVFIAHSHGTFFAKLLLETPFLAARMERMVLVDPIAILLHVPDVAYNATSRTPKHPNELHMAWAATAEPDIAFTLAKRFCWRSHILWQDDLLRCPTTVVVGSDDCLVNAEAIAAYVTKGPPRPDPASVVSKPDLQWSWDDRKSWEANFWSGEGLELYWLVGYDHGQAFFSAPVLRNLVKLVEQYSAKDGVAVVAEKALPGPPSGGDSGPPQGFGLVSKLRGKENKEGHKRTDSGTTRSFFERD